MAEGILFSVVEEWRGLLSVWQFESLKSHHHLEKDLKVTLCVVSCRRLAKEVVFSSRLWTFKFRDEM